MQEKQQVSKVEELAYAAVPPFLHLSRGVILMVPQKGLGIHSQNKSEVVRKRPVFKRQSGIGVYEDLSYSTAVFMTAKDGKPPQGYIHGGAAESLCGLPVESCVEEEREEDGSAYADTEKSLTSSKKWQHKMLIYILKRHQPFI